MATRRNTKMTDDVELPDEIELPDLEEVTIEDELDEEVPAPPARKYFSHANCDHARKGEAGKAARAACRKAIRQWLAAEAEYGADEDVEVDIAV
jgi:hypothetical protein